MNPNEVISQALANGPKVAAEGFWTVEGNPELNQLHIALIGKTCKNNLMAWATGKASGWLLLGVFRSHEDASEFCTLLRDYLRDAEGNLKL